MLRRVAMLGAISTLAASCASPAPAVRAVADVAAAPEVRLTESSPLRMPKAVPVLSPPEVFAVYVPSHVDRTRDILIGEHWVFFKLSDAEWFAERRAVPEPRVDAAVPASELAPLRRLGGLDRAVTPFQEAP